MEVDGLLKSADLALYKAKTEGGNNFRLFETAMATDASARRVLQADLARSLASADEVIIAGVFRSDAIPENDPATCDVIAAGKTPFHSQRMIAPGSEDDWYALRGGERRGLTWGRFTTGHCSWPVCNRLHDKPGAPSS